MLLKKEAMLLSDWISVVYFFSCGPTIVSHCMQLFFVRSKSVATSLLYPYSHNMRYAQLVGGILALYYAQETLILTFDQF